MKYLVDLIKDGHEHRSTRDGFGEALIELAKENSDIVVLTADVAESTRVEDFKEKYPDRFIEVGVAEQNLVGVSTGLALSGKIPVATAFAAFSPGRSWDQLRLACYSQANIKIIGAHAGISVGPDGATHQALEDIALTRVIPNLTVVVPADYEETKKALAAIIDHKGPCYLRLGREKMPSITTAETPFKLGRATRLTAGDDVTVIACGVMVARALKAADRVKSTISAEVIDVHTIKPLDTETVIASAKQTGAIVVVEEHQMSGGLGSAVAEVVSSACPVPIIRVGINDKFGQSGAPLTLLEHYGLGVSDIITAIERVIKLKNAS